MNDNKIELLIPVFFGCLGALVLSAALSAQKIGLWTYTVNNNGVEHTAVVYEAVAEEAPPEVESIHTIIRAMPERGDLIHERYQDPATRARVTDFFADMCDSAEIAEAILVHSDSFDIAPALAVALAWEESRLNPRAVNTKNRNESIDRGLFQLNDRTFPRLETSSFFNIHLNAKYGMSHLRYCLDTGGSEVAALAMYNAGTGRVRSSGTPKTTLDYVSRILNNRWEIENQFKEWDEQFLEPLEELPVIEIAQTKIERERSRLVPLMPLAGRN